MRTRKTTTTILKTCKCAFAALLGFALIQTANAATPIGTAEEFVDQVVADPSGDYILTADLSFTKLAAIPAFSGTLDGDGHKITGLSSNLVNVLTGTIKDLTITNLVFEHQRIKSNVCEPMAAFVLRLQGGTVSGCTLLDSSLTMPNGYAANLGEVGFGGIVAQVEDGGGTISECKVIGCVIGCKTSGDSQLQPFGGIVGRVSTSDPVTISRCQVLGDEVRDTTVSGCRVGGILGGASATVNLVIDGCYNEGVISNAMLTAGGIMGSAADSNKNTAIIDICNCTNVADIAVDCGGVGGIYGYSYKGGRVNITGCVNRGNITSRYNLSTHGATKGTGTGGILGGYYSYPATGGIRIDRSANYGTIFASTNSAGGIIGAYCNGNAATQCIVSNSVNHAAITSSYYAGGLIGAVTAYANCVTGDILVNCCQTGDVTANGEKAAGGLVGYLHGTAKVKDYIKGVCQLGTVTANASASPMIGATGHGDKTFSLYVDCAQIGGSASCATGTVGIVTGAAKATSTGAFTVTVDDASAFANNTGTAYYDQTGAAKELTLNKLSDKAMTNKTAVKALNAYAKENGLVGWVQAANWPDLEIFSKPNSGFMIIVR